MQHYANKIMSAFTFLKLLYELFMCVLRQCCLFARLFFALFGVTPSQVKSPKDSEIAAMGFLQAGCSS